MAVWGRLAYGPNGAPPRVPRPSLGGGHSPEPGTGGRGPGRRPPKQAKQRPRSPRCVWLVVPSGCPFPSPANTPFHAVRAFRELGPVALLVFPACPLRVCALALPRRPRASPLPGLVWRAHHTWFRCRAPVGPFHAVCAPSCFLPRSRALFGPAWGGGGRPGPFPPVPGSGLCAPSWAGLGGGRGGGGLCAVPSRGRGRGGPRGQGVALPRSVPLPSPGRAPKQVALASLSSWRAWSPCCSGSCPRADPGCGLWGCVAYGPNSAPPRVPRPSLGGGGGGGPAGGVKGRRPLGPPSASRGLRAGGEGESGGGRAVVPRRPPPIPWPGPPAAAGGWLEGPGPGTPHTAGSVAPRVPPCRVLGRGCLASPGARRGLGGRRWVSLVGGGGGRSVRRPPAGARLRGLGGRSVGGRSASLGRAPKRASAALPSLWRAWPPYCTGPRLRAAAWTRVAGRLCAPVHDRWPVAGTVGAGGRRTAGRAAYGPSGAPPRVPRPPRGGGGGGSPGPAGGVRGRRPRGRPPAVRGLGRGGGGRAMAPRCPPSVPQCFPPVAAGGWLDGLGPGPPCGWWLRGVSRWRGGGRGGRGGGAILGAGARWGGTPGRWPALLSCPPYGHRASGRRAGPHPRTPRPSRLRRLVAWHRRGGRGGGGGGRRGRRSGSAVSG